MVFFFLELVLPVALEVDGVGDHQRSVVGNGVTADGALYLALGSLVHPPVDGIDGPVRRVAEIKLGQPNPVIGGYGIEEIGPDFQAVLNPEAVGHRQNGPVARFLAVFFPGPYAVVQQGQVQAVQTSVKLLWWNSDTHDVLELRGGAAGGPPHRRPP